MRRPWWRIAAPIAVSGAVIGGLPAAPAAAADGCPGVLVIVEARALGGTSGGCAPNPTDGLSALRQAGFDVTLGTGRYAGGFVCAVDARPARGCDEVDADTYWSYWSMPPGTDRWVYGSVGAASSRPKAGGIEAWVWQEGGAVEPPAARSAIAIVSPLPTAGPPAEIQPAPNQPGQPAPAPPIQQRPQGAVAPAPEPAVTAAPTAAATGGTEPSVPATPADPAAGAVPSPTSDPTLAAAATRSGTDEAGSGPAAWTGVAGLLIAALIGYDALRRARARRRSSG